MKSIYELSTHICPRCNAEFEDLDDCLDCVSDHLRRDAAFVRAKQSVGGFGQGRPDPGCLDEGDEKLSRREWVAIGFIGCTLATLLLCFWR